MENINKNKAEDTTQLNQIEKLVTANKKLKEEILLQKNKEINLINSEEKYRSIISNMELGLAEVDNNDIITSVNYRLNYLTGYSKDELIGKNYIDIFLDAESRKIMEKENKRRKNGITGVYEVKLRKKNGDWLWIIISGAPLYNEDKKIIGTIGAHLDISDRKLMEHELVKSKEAAEGLAELKSHFLANMSHEVRTPMNGIIGLTKLLLDTNLSEKQKEYLNAIDISSNTLLVVVNDILDISKIEAGKMNFENNKFKLVDLISSVVDVFEAKAAEKGIDLESFIDKSIPEYLIGDSIRLNQILYNLINNAIKFTNKGKVVVQIKKINHALSSTYLDISIIDTGIGISKESQLKIFDVFTQAKENTTRKFGGTGLGLTIVKRLVELQGGIIDVESKENKGSKFSVKLKFQTPNQENDVIENHQKKIKDYTSLSGLKVLLAEDNSINQLLINDLLESKKINVETVSNGDDAIKKWLKNDYDLILMDMQMPIKDGYEAMHEIRLHKKIKKRAIPILALTAHATEGEQKKCISAGADNYLSKPFQPNQLLSMIKKMTVKEEKLVTLEAHNLENFNIKTLREFTNNNPKLIVSTLHLLHETLSEDEKSLLNALASDDEKVLKSLTHRMKPNLYLLGLSGLGELCNEIAIDTKLLNEIKDYASIIAKAMPNILKDIKIELNNLEATSF
ncbi:MAG: response regulator [Vicingaceae bacterium]